MDHPVWGLLVMSKEIVMFQPNSDIVLGYFDGEGKAVIRDMFTPGYIPPTPDASQDISEASLKRENGVNVLKFRKKISSGDDKVGDMVIYRECTLRLGRIQGLSATPCQRPSSRE